MPTISTPMTPGAPTMAGGGPTRISSSVGRGGIAGRDLIGKPRFDMGSAYTSLQTYLRDFLGPATPFGKLLASRPDYRPVMDEALGDYRKARDQRPRQFGNSFKSLLGMAASGARAAGDAARAEATETARRRGYAGGAAVEAIRADRTAQKALSDSVFEADVANRQMQATEQANENQRIAGERESALSLYELASRGSSDNLTGLASVYGALNPAGFFGSAVDATEKFGPMATGGPGGGSGVRVGTPTRGGGVVRQSAPRNFNTSGAGQFYAGGNRGAIASAGPRQF